MATTISTSLRLRRLGREKLHANDARDAARVQRPARAYSADIARRADRAQRKDAARAYQEHGPAGEARALAERPLPGAVPTPAPSATANGPTMVPCAAQPTGTVDQSAVLRLRLLGPPLLWRDEQLVHCKTRKTL
ncbi:MAG TPA: hypothetical protein VHB98_16585, partial [Chloroflexota bacterium]|nr:hypothetical protein [Chloroflexota bacterium]